MNITLIKPLRKNLILVLLWLSIGVLFLWTAPASKVKIDSAVFGDIKARNIGPAVMSGRITDIQCVESNPAIVYIGTASGGVWKSKDKGITFEPVFDKYTMSNTGSKIRELPLNRCSINIPCLSAVLLLTPRTRKPYGWVPAKPT